MDSDFVEQHDGSHFVTPLGQAAAWSGLLPTTARTFVELLETNSKSLDERFQDFIGGLIQWVCCRDEFQGKLPSRLLPYPMDGKTVGSANFVADQQLLHPLDRTDMRLCQSVHALILFIEGEKERVIFRRTNMSSGSVHRLATDVSWILDGLHTIAAVPDLSCPQRLGNSLGILARRIRWGAPSEALDLIRIAEHARVPGFGRQRAMALIQCGAETFEDVENLGARRLTKIVDSRSRAEALLKAIREETEFGPNRFAAVHGRLAEQLGVKDVMKDCSEMMEKDYEDAIVRLLRCEKAWSVTVRDDGNRMNEPDILIRFDDVCILLEVKTAPKKTGLVKKEAAFAILQKVMDYEDGVARVTLAKPRFDEMSKGKAASSRVVTLVEHVPFVEAVLRVLSGNITPNEFLAWRIEPGKAEFQRIPGTPTNFLV